MDEMSTWSSGFNWGVACGIWAMIAGAWLSEKIPSPTQRKINKAVRAAVRHHRAMDLAKIRAGYLWEYPLADQTIMDYRRAEALAAAWVEVEEYHRKPFVRLRRRLMRQPVTV